MKLKTMKTREAVLIIILAETRAHELTFPLFKRNLLEPMQADLCLCVANNSKEEKDNPFYQHAKYIWTYDEPDDWGDAIDEMQKLRGVDVEWRQLLEIKDQWLGGVKGDGQHPGSAGILIFFRMFLKTALLKHGVVDKYDRFVVTRSDFLHAFPHVPLKLLDSRYIWIPYGEDYGGYTDRHFIAGRDDILDVLSIVDRIICEPDKLSEEMSYSCTWNLEQFIKFAFEHQGIASKVRRFPYTMYCVRPQGGHTSWSGGRFREELGYFIKYKSEYKNCQFAANLVNQQKNWTRFKFKLYFALKYAQEKPWIQRLIYQPALTKPVKFLFDLPSRK